MLWAVGFGVFSKTKIWAFMFIHLRKVKKMVQSVKESRSAGLDHPDEFGLCIVKRSILQKLDCC